jgi:hypothetical protein
MVPRPIRQLAALRRRLAAAEDELARAQAARKQAEEDYDAASDLFTEVESGPGRGPRTESPSSRLCSQSGKELGPGPAIPGSTPVDLTVNGAFDSGA